MNKGFDMYGKESFIKKLSGVISPIDDFTGNRPIGRIKVSLEGLNIKPVKNPGGFYIILNLLPGSYRFTIESDYYLPYGGELIIPGDGGDIANVDARLIAAVNYPFSPDCPLIRGAVMDKNGQAVSGADVKAGILPGSTRVLKLGKVKSINGNTMEITLDSPSNAAERFNILKVGTGSNKIETCGVKDVLGKEGTLQSVLLKAPFTYSHTGQVVNLEAVDAVETKSNKKGEFAIYFRSFSESTASIKIETSFENKTFICLINGIEQENITVTDLNTTFVKVIEK